jgi:hypothetical protein
MELVSADGGAADGDLGFHYHGGTDGDLVLAMGGECCRASARCYLPPRMFLTP